MSIGYESHQKSLATTLIELNEQLATAQAEAARLDAQVRDLQNTLAHSENASYISSLEESLAQLGELTLKAENEFKSFLSVMKISPTDADGWSRFPELFANISQGLMTSSEAIAAFKRDYSDLLSSSDIGGGFRIEELYSSIESLRGLCTELGDTIRGSMTSTGESFAPVVDGIERIASTVDEIKTAMASLSESATTTSSSLGELAERLSQVNTVGGGQASIQDMSESIERLGSSIGGAFSSGTERGASAVLTALQDIKTAIDGIVVALEPLTTALTTEGTALSNMAKTGAGSIDTLIEKFQELQVLVEQISSKDFSLSMSFNAGGGGVTKYSAAAKEQFSAQVNEYVSGAKQAFDQLVNIYKTYGRQIRLANVNVASDLSGLITNMYNFGDMDKLFNKSFAGLSPSKVQERLNPINTFVSKLKEITGGISGVVNAPEVSSVQTLVDRLVPPTIKSQADEASDSINTLKDAITGATGASNQSAASNIEKIIEAINAGILQIKEQIGSLFTFDELNPNYAKIQEITNTIYTYFQDLATRITTTLATSLGGVGGSISKINFTGTTGAAVESKTASPTVHQDLEGALNRESQALDALNKKYIEHIPAIQTASSVEEEKKSIAAELTDALNKESAAFSAATTAADEYNKVASKRSKSTGQKGSGQQYAGTAEETTLYNLQKQIVNAQKNVKDFSSDSAKTFKSDMDAMAESVGRLLEMVQSGNLPLEDFRSELEAIKNTKAFDELNFARNSYDSTFKTLNVGAADYNSTLSQVRNMMNSVKNLQDKIASGKGVASKETIQDVNSLGSALEKLEVDLDGMDRNKAKAALSELRAELSRLNGEVRSSGSMFSKMFGDIGAGIKSYMAMTFSAFRIIHTTISAIKELISTAVELDTAFTQLQIVTRASDDEIDQFASSMAKTAKEMSASLTDLTDMATVYSRLGYSLSESEVLAKYSSMLQNVGDIDASATSDAMTAIVKAFGIGVDGIESVMDKMVVVGNNFPISVSQIAEGMNNAASMMSNAGMTFDESVAMLTAANTTVQNISKSSTGLRTIVARLRNVKSELDDAGEVWNEAKYQELISALTSGGVQLQKATGELRNPYDVLSELAAKWSSLTSDVKAAITTALAGTRQQDIFSSLMTQFGEATRAMDAMADSAGSLSGAYEIFEDSIQGHINTLKASIQELSMEAIDSGLANSVIDLGSAIIEKITPIVRGLGQIVTELGPIKSLIGAILAFKIVGNIGKIITAFKMLSKVAISVGGIKGILEAASVAAKAFAINLGMSEVAAEGLVATLGPIAIAAAAIGAVVGVIDLLTVSFNEANDAARQSRQELDEAQSNVADCNSKLQETQDRINELRAKGHLTLVEQQELTNLERQNTLLQTQLEILERIEATKNKKAAEDAYNVLTKDSAKYSILDGTVTQTDLEGNTFTSPVYRNGTIIEHARQMQEALNEAQERYNDLKEQQMTIDPEKNKAEYDAITAQLNLLDTQINNYDQAVADDLTIIDEHYGTLVNSGIKEYDEFISEVAALYEFIATGNDEVLKAQKKIDDFLTRPSLKKYVEQVQEAFSDAGRAMSESEFEKAFPELAKQAEANGIRVIDVIDAISSALGLLDFDEVRKQLQSLRPQNIGVSAQDWFSYIGGLDDASLKKLYDARKDGLDWSSWDFSDFDAFFNDVEEGAEDAAEAITDFASAHERLDAAEERINKLTGAYSKLAEGSLELSDVIELIEEFPELAEYVDLTADNFGNLDDGLRAVALNEPTELVNSLMEFATTAGLTDDQRIAVLELANALDSIPTGAIEDVSGEFMTLHDEIMDAKQALNEIKEAMSGDTNTGYATRSEAFQEMMELFSAGAVGSSSKLWDIAEEMGYIGEQDPDTLWEWVRAREAWYDTGEDGKLDSYDSSGIESFLKFVNDNAAAQDWLAANGGKFKFDGSTLDFDFDNANWEEFARVLGLSSEEFTDLMIQAGQFFDIDWEDADDIADYMDEVAMSTQSTEDRFKQLQDAAREALRGEGLDESTIEHLVNGGDVGWLQYADKFDESTQRILANLYELQGQMDALEPGGDPMGLLEISDDADQAQHDLATMAGQLRELGIQAETFRGADFIRIDIESFASTLADSGWSQESISAYMTTLMNSGHYEFTADGEVVADTTEADAAINSVLAEKGKLSDAEATSYKVTGSGESQQNNILRRWAEITKNKTSKYDIYETTHKSTTGGDQKVNGTAHASGSWGTARSERALTGELGTELVVDPSTGRWYTVGENGAEFVNIPKGSIVFNHKQTEAILNNGFVTGRGRAYASGSGSIRKYSSSSYGGYSSSSSSSNKGKTSGYSSSKSSSTNSSSAKTELDNWFERRYEEHQHLLAMEQESQARYLDWLMDSYQLAYDEGIITLEELHKYQEEVFNGLREMYEDYLDDLEHEVSMREHFKGEEQAVIKLYQEAIASIQAEIDEARAAGLTDTDDYVQKLQDRFWKLTEALEKMEDDYTKNAESTTDKLIDLRQKMIKQEIKDEQDALKKRLSNLKDFYQKQKDLLQDSYDDEKYIKEQTEKRKSVTDIQMELERLSLDNSAWAQKRRLELSEELAKAQEELDEFEKDHALDMAKEQLDEMYELQETAINDRIDLLDEKLDYAKGIYDQALEDIRNGSIELYEDMILYNNRYGDGIADTITATWEDAYAALQDYYNLYNEDFNNIHLANATNYSTSGSWDSHSISDKGTSVTEATEYPANNKSGQWKQNSKGWWYEYNNGEYPTSTWENIDDKWYHFNSSGYMQTGWVKSNGYWYYLNSDGTMASNTWKKYNGKWYYLGANGQMKTGWFKDGNTWYYLNSSGAMVTGSQKIGGKTYHFGSSGAWLGYASGTKHAVSGLHKVDEHGDEYVFESANGNRYRMFSGGEKVLNAQATNFLYQFATSGGKILTDLIKNSFNRGDLERVSNSRQNVEINMGDIIISGNADQRTVSQIRREQREGIDYVLTQFAKLNK